MPQGKVGFAYHIGREERLAPADVGTLASLDPAWLLAAPRGMEAGYVPIATRQELHTQR